MLESILSRIRKILALAEQGVGGERENAKSILQKLLDKHGLTVEDIVREEKDQQQQIYSFRYKSKLESDLLHQCYCCVIPQSERTHYKRRGRKCLGFKLTLLQKLELENYWNYFRGLWKQELKLFFLTFIHKHDIFAHTTSPSDMESKLTQEELDRMMDLMSGLSRSNYISTKRLLTSRTGDKGHGKRTNARG